MDLRPLTADAAPALLALHRECPIEADLSFYLDRSPDFFAWPAAIFDGFAYVGGFEGDALVACALLGTAAGEACPGGTFSFAGDVRVAPEARGRGFSRRAAAALAPLAVPSGLTLGLVKRGNAAAHRAAAALARSGFDITILCEYRVANLLLVGSAPSPARCRVRRARQGDLPLLADLMGRAFRGRPFAPRGEPESLSRDLARLPGLALEDFYLAFAGGEPAGALGTWDAGPLRRAVVLRYSWRGRMARLGYALARRLRPAIAPAPRTGQCLRAVTTTRVAVPGGDPAVLHDLLAAVHRDRTGSGYHLIQLGLAAGDPLLAAVRGFPRQTLASDLVLVTASGVPVPGRLAGPPHLDLRYV